MSSVDPGKKQLEWRPTGSTETLKGVRSRAFPRTTRIDRPRSGEERDASTGRRGLPKRGQRELHVCSDIAGKLAQDPTVIRSQRPGLDEARLRSLSPGPDTIGPQRWREAVSAAPAWHQVRNKMTDHQWDNVSKSRGDLGHELRSDISAPHGEFLALRGAQVIQGQRRTQTIDPCAFLARTALDGNLVPSTEYLVFAYQAPSVPAPPSAAS